MHKELKMLKRVLAVVAAIFALLIITSAAAVPGPTIGQPELTQISAAPMPAPEKVQWCGEWYWPFPPPPSATRAEVKEYLEGVFEVYGEEGCPHCGDPTTIYQHANHMLKDCDETPDIFKEPDAVIPYNIDMDGILDRLSGFDFNN
jgi:hypothetical protein